MGPPPIERCGPQPAVAPDPRADLDLAAGRADPIQLKPGAAPGTWHLRYVDRVRWSGTPPGPTTVTLGSTLRTIATVEGPPDGTFAIEVDLPPGMWTVQSTTTADGWEDAVGPTISLDATGLLRCKIDCGGPCHDRKLAIASPAPLAVVADPRPTLTWTEVPGATGYRLDWFEHESGSALLASTGGVQVAGASWTFPAPVPRGREVDWDVYATGEGGRILAHGNSTFLTPGAAHPVAPAGWLGIAFAPDPTRAVVADVAPGSPAEAAGLRPLDALVEIGDQPVRSLADALDAVARAGVGATLDLYVVRDGRWTTLHPTVAGRPSP